MSFPSMLRVNHRPLSYPYLYADWILIFGAFDFNLVYGSLHYVFQLVLNVSQMPFLLFSCLPELDLSLLWNLSVS